MSQVFNSEKEKNSTVTGNIYDAFILNTHRFLITIKKRIGLLLLCILFTTGVLLVNNNANKDLYKSSFTVSYDDLVRKIYGDRLEKIDALLQHRDYAKVSTLLGIPVSITDKLIKIKAVNILGQDLSEDMNTDRIPFTVTFVVNDSAVIPTIQNGLVNFLESGNAYMAEKKDIKLREVLEELDFIDSQLKMMDSLKKKYNENSFSVSDMKTTNPNSSASTIYQFSYELYKRKQELMRKKSMPANVQVIDDAILPKPLYHSFITILFLGIISGAVLYLFMNYLFIPVIRGRR